jgi:hypothetical protein
MRDKRIRFRPCERQRLMDDVRGFVMTGAGHYSKWRTLELMVRRWPEVMQIAASEPGPYIYSVTQERSPTRLA